MFTRLSRGCAPLMVAGLLAAPCAGFDVIGRVVEHGSGEAVEGARLTLRNLDLRQTASATTDERGYFQLEAGFRGRCQIELTKPGYASSVLFASLDGDLVIALRMIKGGVIAGRVASASGAPVPRALVTILRRLSGSAIFDRLTASDGMPVVAATDAQGAFRLFGLPPGSYSVSAVSSVDDISSGSEAPVLEVVSQPQFFSMTAGEEHRNVEFTLSASSAGAVSGRVEGGPPEGAVLVSLLPREFPGFARAKALAESDGTFSFRGIPAGAYSLFAVGPSSGSGGYAGIAGAAPVFARTEVEVTPGRSQEIHVRMEPGKTALFQLAGPDRTSASACSRNGTLALTSLEAWGAQTGRRAEITALRPTALRDLAPARYIARATDLQEGCYSSTAVVDLRSEGSSAIPVTVLPGCNFRGRLLAPEACATRRPVLLLWPSASQDGEPGVMIVLPDALGHFTADLLRPGPYRVLTVGEEEWSDPGWRPDFSGAFEMQCRSGTTEVDIPSPPGQPDARCQSTGQVSGRRELPRP